MLLEEAPTRSIQEFKLMQCTSFFIKDFSSFIYFRVKKECFIPQYFTGGPM